MLSVEAPVSTTPDLVAEEIATSSEWAVRAASLFSPGDLNESVQVRADKFEKASLTRHS